MIQTIKDSKRGNLNRHFPMRKSNLEIPKRGYLSFQPRKSPLQESRRYWVGNELFSPFLRGFSDRDLNKRAEQIAIFTHNGKQFCWVHRDKTPTGRTYNRVQIEFDSKPI